jgi:hypothetical protein
LLLPGLTDAHCHFLDAGLRLLSVKLKSVKNKEDFRKQISDYVSSLPSGSWILGGDWDHHSFGGELPSKDWIDDITPNNPVWVNRMDGHMSLANSCALRIAGITRFTDQVPGGTIVHDSKGDLTGILKDNAMNIMTPYIPKYSLETNNKALEAAMSHVIQYGITKVHTMVTVDCACGLWPKNLGRDAEHQDMDIAYEELDIYMNAYKEGRLRTRIRAAVPLASWKRLLTTVMSKESNMTLVNGRSPTDSWLQVGCLKAMIDGSLGSHTAAFFEDYNDTPGDKGHLIWDPVILESYVHDATKHGLQVMVHAIGDKANHIQLNIFENVQNKISGDHRFRIEHAQHIAESDIPRFGKLGVIASMQMTHLAEDGRWAEAAIGHNRLI